MEKGGVSLSLCPQLGWPAAAARASLPPSLDKWLEKLRPPTLMSSTIELMTILYQGRGRREAGWLAARGAHMEKNAEEEKKIS